MRPGELVALRDRSSPDRARAVGDRRDGRVRHPRPAHRSPRSWSARRSPPPARRTRACSAIRWSRPTSSACRRARRSARCSASSCRCRVSAIQGLAFAFGLAAVGAAYAIAARAARARSPARAGARRRRARRAARRVHRAAQVPRRSLQPAAGDHLLAARQPRGDDAARTSCSTLLPVRARPRRRSGCCAGGSTCCRSATRRRARSGIDAGRVRAVVIAAATLMTAAVGVDLPASSAGSAC